MKILFKTNKLDSENWISVSDLMAGLMFVFLFILILYARSADERSQNAKKIVTEWRNSEQAIYRALNDEFEKDLERWKADIDRETLTVWFKSPDILFETGKAELRPEFEDILDDFMPRYIDLLKNKFDSKIEEVRIEGHTSSEWEDSLNETDAFIKNMALSQERTRAVLNYTLGLDDIEKHTSWIRKTVSANGVSSARPIIKQGNEDKDLSKRVDFRINTKAKEALFEIIERIAPEIKKAYQ